MEDLCQDIVMLWCWAMSDPVSNTTHNRKNQMSVTLAWPMTGCWRDQLGSCFCPVDLWAQLPTARYRKSRSNTSFPLATTWLNSTFFITFEYHLNIARWPKVLRHRYMWHKQSTTMEDIQVMVYFLLHQTQTCLGLVTGSWCWFVCKSKNQSEQAGLKQLFLWWRNNMLERKWIHKSEDKRGKSGLCQPVNFPNKGK